MCTETIESCDGRSFINIEYLVILGIYFSLSEYINNVTVILGSLLNNDILTYASISLTLIQHMSIIMFQL